QRMGGVAGEVRIRRSRRRSGPPGRPGSGQGSPQQRAAVARRVGGDLPRRAAPGPPPDGLLLARPDQPAPDSHGAGGPRRRGHPRRGVRRGCPHGTPSTMSARLRGAIIGFGKVAEIAHLPAWLARDDVTIVAVAEPDATRRARAAELLPAARLYGDPGELLREAATLDFVDIATPPALPAPLTLP